MSDITIKENEKIFVKVGDGISCEIIADFDLTNCTASSFGFSLRYSEEEETLLECNISSAELIFDRSHSDYVSKGIRKCPLESASKQNIRLHIFVDTCSVEVFTDDGRTVMYSNIYPSKESNGIYLYSRDGSVKLNNLKTWGLS